jgi:protein TonB
VVIDDLGDVVPAGPYVPSSTGPATSGDRNGFPGGILDTIPTLVPRVAPPVPVAAITPPPAPTKPPRITVLQMAEPIQRVNPVYPPLARSMRVSGKVELMGVLGTDGRIHEIKVVGGHPLLVKAAVDAVMQWVYRPTILNGQPVEVQAPITVSFILN